jgi:hypothetical protein
MSSKLVSLRAAEVCPTVYTRSHSRSYYNVKLKYNNPNPEDFNTDDTYMIVFNPSQDDMRKTFLQYVKEHPNVFNILYEAPQAYNIYHGRNEGLRNWLIIFEKNG